MFSQAILVNNGNKAIPVRTSIYSSNDISLTQTLANTNRQNWWNLNDRLDFITFDDKVVGRRIKEDNTMMETTVRERPVRKTRAAKRSIVRFWFMAMPIVPIWLLSVYAQSDFLAMQNVHIKRFQQLEEDSGFKWRCSSCVKETILTLSINMWERPLNEIRCIKN